MRLRKMINKIKALTPLEKLAWGLVLIGLLSFLTYFVAMALSGYKMLHKLDDDDLATTGQIGDFFGGVVGSLWALAGVFLYFSALKLQSDQLKTQMLEMNQNKKLMSQQQFETTFFNLLSAQQTIKSNIKEKFFSVRVNDNGYEYSSKEEGGNDFFFRIRSELISIYESLNEKEYKCWNQEVQDDFFHIHNQAKQYEEYGGGELGKEYCRSLELSYVNRVYNIKQSNFESLKEHYSVLEHCVYAYMKLFFRYENSLGHYCRHLYNIVKFLDKYWTDELESVKGSNDEVEKKKIDDRMKMYLAFIHSSLSTAELTVLFYNCLLFPKAEALFVKYNLLENLMSERLICSEHASLMTDLKMKSINRFEERIKEIRLKEKV